MCLLSQWLSGSFFNRRESRWWDINSQTYRWEICFIYIDIYIILFVGSWSFKVIWDVHEGPSNTRPSKCQRHNKEHGGGPSESTSEEDWAIGDYQVGWLSWMSSWLSICLAIFQKKPLASFYVQVREPIQIIAYNDTWGSMYYFLLPNYSPESTFLNYIHSLCYVICLNCCNQFSSMWH